MLGAYAYAGAAGGAGSAAVAALLALVPASELAVLLVQRVVAARVQPRRLPRLDLGDGVPESARTLVVVPVLLGSVREVERLVAHLEVQALGNLDPRIHFALLTDFKDARTATVAGDDEILAAAVAAIEALNRKHRPEGNDRFFLFHRERRWNAKQNVFMGWERKRGKIEELNRLLRGADDTGFTVRIGDLAILPSVRFVLTLDADTRLPRDAARALIGILAHPLQRPVVDAALRKVTAGYGILQPRVSVNLTSAAGSLFARVYSGHTGVDPYTTAVSDTYQDLFGAGIFTGKGLYDVDAFQTAVGWRVPENALLSHDLFEGLYARTALVSDVELVDDYPANLLAHARRQHRWVRGDWQILAWLFPWVPTPEGYRKNRLPLISQWKILDNLRRSLVTPALLAYFAAAWTLLPGNPLVWTLGGLAVVAFPLVTSLFHLLEPRAAQEPVRVHLRGLAGDLSTAFAQAFLSLVFLPFHAWVMVHAITLTLVRVGITQRRLLEWETAAAQGARAAGLLRAGVRPFFVEMAASPLAALALLALVVAARPGALPLALPFLLSWAAAPACAYWLSRSTAPRRSELAPEDRELLTEVARKTWLYFETLVGPEDHWLPPDNYQEDREPSVAHRTSPTNLGLGLLATLAAHDLGWLTAAALAERLDRTLTSIESLERHEGHLLNWYDTQNLAPLLPRYVSTVDSGNLAGALLALAEGCREISRRAESPGPEVAARLSDIARRAAALAEGMNFTFLYDRRRKLFAIGYRLADAGGPGRADLSFYDLLASEARLASFFAIAKGDVPQSHWFHLGRLVVSVSGVPTLVSWSATMFEYLMPLLLMRSYPGTLLEQTCRRVVEKQIRYGRERRVPWGISESAYDLVDRPGNYQYKEFGVPGLGLKRGLADELVVAPYATALAALLEPAEAACNLRRLADEGAVGPYGYYDAIDYTPRKPDESGEPAGSRATVGVVVRTHLAHHQGMTLVALANVLLGDRMVERFHADPRIQATELLLQERIPRAAPVVSPHPAEESRVEPPALVRAPRRLRSPHTALPAGADPLERQLCHGRHQWRRRHQLLPRPGGDPVASGPHARPRQPVRLSARRPLGRGLVRRLPAHLRRARELLRGAPRREGHHRAARPRDRDAVRGRGLSGRRRRGPARVAHQPERPSPRDRADQLRRARARLDRRGRRQPGVRQAVRRDRVDRREHGPAGAEAAALPRRDPPVVAFHVALHPGTDAGAGRVGDRPDALPRPRAQPRQPERAGWARALGPDRRRARPDPEPADPPAARPRRLRPGLLHDRRRRRRAGGARLRAEVPRPWRGGPRLRPGLHPGAGVAAPPRGLRRAGPGRGAARLARLLLRRLAARRPGDAGAQHARSGRALATRPLGRPPDRPRARPGAGARGARPRGPHRPRELAPEGALGGRRDPQRARGGLPRGAPRTARAARRRRPVERLAGEVRRQSSCFVATPCRRPSGSCSSAVARAVLSGELGTLEQQLDRAEPEPPLPLTEPPVDEDRGGAGRPQNGPSRRRCSSATVSAASRGTAASTSSCSTASGRRRCRGSTCSPTRASAAS